MRDIKFQYIVIGKCGNTMKEVFPLHDIEKGYATKWLQTNTIRGDIHRRRFTGLQDKNGADIYEGDIIDDQFDCGQLVIILWNDDKACFESKDVKFCAMMERHYQRPISICTKTITKGVVIGNIHSNPELLEK